MKVLKLNRFWQPVGVQLVKDAIISMNSSKGPHTLALDIHYNLDEDGYPIYDRPALAINPLYWDEWSKLPVRKWDQEIRSVKERFRVPTVIIAENYTKIPMVTWFPSKRRILERDEFRCQYSNKELTFSNASVDHIIPKKLGGRDEWENLVACHKEINFKKGHKTNKEAGLKLIRKPFAPKKVPKSSIILKDYLKGEGCEDWKLFLIY